MKKIKLILISLILLIPLKPLAAQDQALPQYLFPAFSPALLKMKDGNTKELDLNYNMITGRMVFKMDGKLYDLLNPEVVDTVYMQKTRFVRFENSFYEVLRTGSLSLFLQNKGTVVPAGKDAGYGATSQTSSATTLSGLYTNSSYFNLELPDDVEVQVSVLYWLRKGDNMFSFKNQKQFLEIFPGREDELKGFIKAGRIKFDNKQDIVKLLGLCK